MDQINCNKCINVSQTEEEQKRDYRSFPHICQIYHRRVIHRSSRLGYHSMIWPCGDCVKSGYINYKPVQEAYDVQYTCINDFPPADCDTICFQYDRAQCCHRCVGFDPSRKCLKHGGRYTGHGDCCVDFERRQSEIVR